MNRRAFVVGIGAMVVAPLEVQAQPGVVRVGILASGSPRSVPLIGVFEQRLRELGFVEGQNLIVEFRTAEGRAERLPTLARDLVRLKADVILAPTAPAVHAVKQATGTIPIVTIATDYDPIAAGFGASLSRPGGNVTGLFLRQLELTAKQLGLLKDALPQVSRVAVLSDEFSADQLRTAEAAARSLHVQLEPFELRNAPYDFEGALRAAVEARAGALLALAFPLMYRDRDHVAALALKRRLPGMFPFRENVEAGGLMAYGANLSEMYRNAATYTGKILKGANPVDLPMEQPTKFELVINLKTAKAIGLTVPPALLSRADEVIE